ncbi:MAG: 6-phosphogluconolactonase [Deltaproteobacteria bacterium]|nr:6-phosphogluconolactonase [Deltaproteobacteria bacterium]
MEREVKRYPNLAALGKAAAEFISTLAVECVNEHGVFTIALSGGKTPISLYQNLAKPPYQPRMPWSHIHLFWGDERCVPSDHPDSNFAMAFRSLISKVPITPRNVHRIPGEVEPPEDAAAAYENFLREFFGSTLQRDRHSNVSSMSESFPSFDLILLGMGKDGHTASLFPGDEAVEGEKRWMAAVRNPRGSPLVPRITLTLPVINRARCILFLVSGSGKEKVLRTILEDPDSAARLYPAARVMPDGRVVWFIDEETV